MSDRGDNSPRESSVERISAGLLPSSQRRSVVIFCMTTFFFWIALYLYVPILPVYAQSLGASLSMVGIVVASYSLPQVLLRIPLGIWFDALGRRKPLVTGGIAMAFLGALGLGLAPNVWVLALGRAFTGVGGAAWVAFIAFFAAYYPRQESGRAISIMKIKSSR